MNKFNFKKIAIGLMIPMIFQSCFVSNVAGMEKTETSSLKRSMMLIDDTITRYVYCFQPDHIFSDAEKEGIFKVLTEIGDLIPSLYEKYNGSSRELDMYLTSYYQFLVDVRNAFWDKDALELMYKIDSIVSKYKNEKNFSFPAFDNRSRNDWWYDE